MDRVINFLKSAKMAQTPAAETQGLRSMETASVRASVESLTIAEEIQGAISNKDEEQSTGTNEPHPEFSTADSRKIQDHLQKTNPSDIDPRDLEIMHLKLMNKALKERIERLENNDQYLEPLSPRVNLIENVNVYTEALQKLDDSFASSYFRYTEGQNIVLECAKAIDGIKSMNFREDSSLIESDLAEYKKKLTGYSKKLTDEQIKIMQDKQKMIDAERQFHKILSDHKFLINKLRSSTLKNIKLIKKIVDLDEQQESFIQKVEDFHQEMMPYFETVKQSMDEYADEKKLLEDEVKTLKKKHIVENNCTTSKK